LLAEDDFDHRRAVSVFPQNVVRWLSKTGTVAKCNSVPRRARPRECGGVVDDMHQRHAIEGDIETRILVRKPGRIGDFEGCRWIVGTGRAIIASE